MAPDIHKRNIEYAYVPTRENNACLTSQYDHEYLPEQNVQVSHNEWYAVSWEMDFGKQIDEHETSDSASTKEQTVTQKVTNMNDEKTTQQETDNQTEDTNDASPPSTDFSNLNTDVENNPYICRPHPLKIHLFPQITAYSSWI